MNISIIGTGYVGLVSGVCLAELGHKVQCVDVDTSKVDLINSGISPIYEKDLDALLKKNAGIRLEATTNLKRAVHETELSNIAVGTPFDGHEIDLSYIFISHNMDFISQTTDQIYGMTEGRILLEERKIPHTHGHSHGYGDLPHTHADEEHG